jgi:hypothetical protein
MTVRRLIVLLALLAAIVSVQSATAASSPNMRLMYSLLDPTSGRTDSDIAFWGNIGVAGNYDGFRVFNTQTQQVLATKLCRGPQNDVGLWEHNGRLLLFMGIDQPQRNTDGNDFCSEVRSSDTTACGPPFCFEGIRIFDLTNPTNPVLIKSVHTQCGSHTHTIVPDLKNTRILLYISSYPGGSGPNCVAPFRKISIVEVPLDAPETASVLSTPPTTPTVPGCHDITVFMAINKAAAACDDEGQIWDISDPANPNTLNPLHIDDPGVNYWHSAAFTWDGQYVVYMDESFSVHGCSPGGDGKIRIFRVSDGQVMSAYTIPRPQPGAYCSVHNGNIVPVLGKYVLVAGWYYGGTSVVDFTNPMQPREVAYYDFTPTSGQSWSSYWYNGRIYSNDMNRGVDVFQMMTPYTPYGQQWTHLNAQTQEDLYVPNITALGQLAPRR